MALTVLAAWLSFATSYLSQSVRSVRFIDVTAKAGIRFVHENSPTPEKYLAETMGSGGAFIDIDGDGLLDVFLLNGGWTPGSDRTKKFNHALFRNRGDGTFEDVTAKSGVESNKAFGMGAAVADYDNDGDDDLFVTNFNGPNVLYRNNGSGAFSDVTAVSRVGGDGKWSSSAAFADYDNDGFLDLFVVRYVEHTFENNRICGPATDPTLRAYCTPQVYDGLSNILYRNNGNGTFRDVSTESGIAAHRGKGLGVTMLDFNRDGFVDIYVANDSVENFLFRNNHDGTFAEVALEAGVALDENGKPQAGMGTTSGDFDGDAFPDIVVTNLDFEYMNVFRNLRNELFEDASAQTGVQLATRPFVGFGVGLFDFDNDSDLDVFVANGHILDNAARIREGASYRQRKLVFENTGSRFREVASDLGEALLIPQVSRGLATADFDNDGDVDVLITNCGGSPMLLRNEDRSGNSWLKIKLIGTKANRNAYGARIEVTAGTRKLMREVTAGGSYLSSSDYRMNFGLGDFKEPVDIEIFWPGGPVQSLKQAGTGRMIVIEQPRF